MPGACERLEPYLSANLVGQELAVRQACDAVCDHLAAPEPRKPLVLSVHGPPGVGKSLFHLLAARALYAARPHARLRCPGADCPGYKVLYGMDYTSDDRAAQHAALQAALLDHVRAAPEALLVVEEYDKLDCHMRGFFRHLLEGGTVGNASLARAVVVLESNTGYTALHAMLAGAGARGAIPPDAAQRELKDLVFSRWRAQGCEEHADTMKMVGVVDLFLPFFPLERAHVGRLFAMRLRDRGDALAAARLGGLGWGAGVVEFLTNKVEFDGAYPIEGGKEVATRVTVHASRPLRAWAAAQEARLAEALQRGGVDRRDPAPVGSGLLRVAPGGEALEVVRAPPGARLERAGLDVA